MSAHVMQCKHGLLAISHAISCHRIDCPWTGSKHVMHHPAPSRQISQTGISERLQVYYTVNQKRAKQGDRLLTVDHCCLKLCSPTIIDMKSVAVPHH